MNRTIRWLLIATVALAVAGIGFATWRLTGRSFRFYTDGDRIRQRAERAWPRDILWQPPERVDTSGVAPINTDGAEYEPRYSADGAALYFVRGRPGENADLYECRRTPDGWASPVAVAEINTEFDELGPELSSDGRRLFFYSDRPGGAGGFDIWVSERGTDGWEAPVVAPAPINSPFHEYGCALAPDGRTLYLSSDRPRETSEATEPGAPWRATIRENLHGRTFDIYRVEIAGDGDGGRCEPVDVLNTSADEGAIAFSPVGDFLYFASDRAAGRGGFDIYRARVLRGVVGHAEPLDESINTPANELDPTLTAEGFRLAFSSDRPVGPGVGERNYDLYTTASREVFRETEYVRPEPINWQAIGSIGLAGLLAAALAALLAWLLWKLWSDLRRRNIGLLGRCLLMSLFAHLALLLLSTYWMVSQGVLAGVTRKGGAVRLAASVGEGAESAAGLAEQIRGLSSSDAGVWDSTNKPAAFTVSLPAPEMSIEPTPVPSLAPALLPLAATTAVAPASPVSVTSVAVPITPPLDPALASSEQRLPSPQAPSVLAERAPAPPTPSVGASRVAAPILAAPRASLSPAISGLDPLHLPDEPISAGRPARSSAMPKVEMSAVSPSNVGAPDQTIAALAATAAVSSHALPQPTRPEVGGAEGSAAETASDDMAAKASLLTVPKSPGGTGVALPARSPAREEIGLTAMSIPTGGSIANEATAHTAGPPMAAPRPSVTTAPDTNWVTALFPSAALNGDRSVAPRLPSAGAKAPEVDDDAARVAANIVPEAPAGPRADLSPGVVARLIQLPAPPPTAIAPLGDLWFGHVPSATATDTRSLPVPSRGAEVLTPMSAIVGTLGSPELDRLDLAVPAGDAAPESEAYAQRSEELRPAVLEQMGGNEDTERAVRAALDWLARHQSRDGRWDGGSFDDECGQCGGTTTFDVDVALTGLSVLCFLASDHTHTKDGPYRQHVSQGLDWLLRQQAADGDLRRGETMYSHGIATIALSEALGMTGDGRLREPVRRAIGFIERARSSAGGWRYDPGQFGDTSVLGWQIMALKSAERAGLSIRPQSYAGADAWLKLVSTSRRSGLVSYQPGRAPTVTMTAEGLFVRQLLGQRREQAESIAAVRLVLENPPKWQTPNTYYWYYATLAMFHHQGDDWTKWNELMQAQLIPNQRDNGALAGSWDPVGEWADIGGRVYQTALCTLTLEVYYRYLPMYRGSKLTDASGPTGASDRAP